MKSWWEQAFLDYDVAPHQVHLLTLACQAFDRAEEARKIVDSKGISAVDRFGQEKPRGEVMVERDSRRAFAEILRQLDFKPPPQPPR